VILTKKKKKHFWAYNAPPGGALVYLKHFLTCPYDIYRVNYRKFSVVRTGCGTTYAIQTIDFCPSDIALKTVGQMELKLCSGNQIANGRRDRRQGG
jgi:hypothetical protein